MQLDLPGKPHLSYCTNIHAGETWVEIEAALASYLPAIKRQVAPAVSMGIGLRLSAVAARGLAVPHVFERFKRFLHEGGFYVFTINAFPYGSFHGTRVKERVYEPDWRTLERLRFTAEAADVLARLLPEGGIGSVSTVPGGFRESIATPNDVVSVAEGLVRAVAHLHNLRETSGRTIVLAIEPEPACFLETTNEAVRFLEDKLFSASSRAVLSGLTGMSSDRSEEALRRHLGLCFDVCHSAVAFEETAATLDDVCAAGISVAKLQFSSALSATGRMSDLRHLFQKFDDGIYLHQAVERRNGVLTRYTDLPEAFAAAERHGESSEWRVHCHVPVFLDRFDGLGSTQANLREALALCRRRKVAPHLEVETYTWSVLPPGIRNSDLAGDIVRELQWIQSELRLARVSNGARR